MCVRFHRLADLLGVLFCTLGAYLLGGVYELCAENPLGILFGAVNGSIWESSKALIVTYVVWGIVGLFCLKPCFRAYIVSKAFGLWTALGVYILLCVVIVQARYAAAVIALSAGFVMDCFLMKRDCGKLFHTACYMLLLVFVMFFCFTVNPPRLFIFRDPTTSMYGIIPRDIDMGAFCI